MAQPPKDKIEEFRADRAMFRGAHRVMPDGKLFGDVRHDVQEAAMFGPLQLRVKKYFLFRLGRGWDKSSGIAFYCVEEVVVSKKKISIIIFAADSEQAGIILSEIKGFIDRDALLSGSGFKVNKNEIIYRGSSIKIMASDSVGSFGTTADIYIIDEFSSWHTQAHSILFTSIYTACAKKKDATLIVASNAGGSFSKVYFEYIERIRKSPDWYVFEHEGPAPWLDAKIIEGQKAFLPASVFLRLFGNVDVRGAGNFFTEDDVERITDESLSPKYKGSDSFEYFIGLDCGLTKDMTSVSVVHREGSSVVLDLQRNWQGSPKSPVNLGEVEAFIVDLERNFNIAQMVFDPYQAQHLSQRVSAVLPVLQFNFTGPNWNLLATRLSSIVRYGRLRIYRDATLEGQLLAVEVVQTVNGIKFQNRSGFHDDCVVSLALACHGALATNELPDNSVASFESNFSMLERDGKTGNVRKLNVGYLGGIPDRLTAEEERHHSKSWRRGDSDLGADDVRY